MQFKDIVLLLAAAGSAAALPAPEGEAPVRRAEQAEQAEAATQEKQGKQWVNPQLNSLFAGSNNLGFPSGNNRWDPRFQDPRFLSLFGNNGFDPDDFDDFFKRDVDMENHLARRAEQAQQGKQIFGNPGFGGNDWNNGFGNNNDGLTVSGFGGGSVNLGQNQNPWDQWNGNNNFNPNFNNRFFNNRFPGRRFNQFGNNGFPSFFGNQNNGPFNNGPFNNGPFNNNPFF